MKRLLCCALILALLGLCPALAEEGVFDLGALYDDETLYVYLDDNRIDTVYRPMDQPYPGELSEGGLVTFLDYVDLAEAGAVVLRFALAVQTESLLNAGSVTLSCGGAVVQRELNPTCTEYDGVYMEDYYIPLSGEDFALIRALLAGDGVLSVTLQSDRTITGTVRIPTDSLRTVWETYQACGGLTQDFSGLEGR